MDFKLLITALLLTIVASVPDKGYPGPVNQFVTKKQCEKKCTRAKEFCKSITNHPFMWECSDACTMCIAYGSRVKRGPTWQNGDQDSCGGTATCAANGSCEGEIDRAYGYCYEGGTWVENCYLYQVKWDCGFTTYVVRQGGTYCDVILI